MKNKDNVLAVAVDSRWIDVPPGIIVGDNPFQLADSGGVCAVWIKARRGRTGRIRIEAEHASLGSKLVEIAVRASSNRG